MKPHQSLVYYKRHTPSCPLKADKFNFGCDCMIWIMGRTPTGTQVPRQSTQATTMVVAAKFGQTLTAQSVAANPQPTVHGYNLPDAMDAFLLSRREGISDGVYREYMRVFNLFTTYCFNLGVSYMREIKVDTVETFRATCLTGEPGTKEKAMNKLRCFLSDAYTREWIEKPLQIKPRKFRRKGTAPFTDQEVALILDGAGNSANLHGLGKHGGTFRLLLEFMLETGLRVGDAVLFEPAQMVRGDYMWLYTFEPQKQKIVSEKVTVTVYLPDSLKQRIDACRWMKPTMPFHPSTLKRRKSTPESKPSRPGTVVWQLMQDLGTKVGVLDCRPHRLRDTCAVQKLTNGATLDDVSRLLGHASVTMTERYYARWTPDRSRGLEQRLAMLRKVPQNGGF